MSQNTRTSDATRIAVLAAVRAGVSNREVGKTFGIDEATVRRIRIAASAAQQIDDPDEVEEQEAETSPKTEKKETLYARAILSERTRKADWDATREDCVADLRNVQGSNPDNFISRNFYRVNGTYSDSTWNQHFGTFAQFRRSAGLELSRSQQHLEKHIARHAHLDTYRKFYTEEVAPWVGKYEKTHAEGRIKTVLIGSDFHDVDVDRFALSVFIDTAKRLQPDIIVFNGDTYDQYEFSRYDQDPRQVNLKGRYDFVRNEIFNPIREACPNTQLDFIIGNHEQRILTLLADRSPSMKVLVDFMGVTFSQLLGLDEHKINLISKADFSAYSTKERHAEVKKNYKKYFDTFICHHFGDEDYALSSVGGHTHKPKLMTKANEVMGPIFALTCGSMCKIDAEYHQQKVNAQNSFVIVHVDTWERSAVPEHIMFGKEHCVVGGKYYFRTDEAFLNG